jgi:hypothetical protein
MALSVQPELVKTVEGIQQLEENIIIHKFSNLKKQTNLILCKIRTNTVMPISTMNFTLESFNKVLNSNSDYTKLKLEEFVSIQNYSKNVSYNNFLNNLNFNQLMANCNSFSKLFV